MSEKIRLVIDGQQVEADPHASIIQAYARAGSALTSNVGCMGQGVCGSCRCLVRREGERDVRPALACETSAEEGMQVSFVDYFTPNHVHYYDLQQLGDGWRRLEEMSELFPEAEHCRHCGGCDSACPKQLAVQQGVASAVAGDFDAVDSIFDQCVMCNLCTLACPENIRPNHLGLFVRRMRAVTSLRPSDLLRRLKQIDTGEMRVEIAEPAQAGQGGAS